MPNASTILLVAATLAAMLVDTGCWFRRKPKVAPPVIAAPPSTRTPPAENPQVPPPPKVATPESPQVTLTPPPMETPVPEPPKPEPPPRRARRTPTPAAKPSPSAPNAAETPEPERPTVPQLTQLLSPSEQSAHNRAIDSSLVQARERLGQLDQRRLNASQRSTYERAQAFILQAEQTRGTDLATAKALAERAVILAEDLTRGAR